MTFQELDRQLQSEFEANKAEQSTILNNIDDLIQAFSDINNDELSLAMSILYKKLEVEFIEENEANAHQIEEWKDKAVRAERVTK